MNQLAIFTDNAATMTSLEIADLVESEHGKVRQSIERLAKRGVIQLPPMGKVENIQSLSPNNRSAIYVFSGEQGKRDSIIVVAQLSPEFTARLVDRWKALEEGKVTHAFALPQTLHEALRFAADLAEKNTKLVESAQKAVPKIAFHDAVRSCPDTMEIGRFAKILGTGRNRMFEWLRVHKYLMANNLPYQPYIDSGLFRVVERTITVKGEDKLKSTTYITGKGQVIIHKKWAASRVLAMQEAGKISNLGRPHCSTSI